MSIITPPIFTPVHQEEFDELQPTTEEVIRKLIRNNNFLLDLAPVGTIIFVNSNQLGGGQPSSSFWQVCDGSEITNPNSPLRSLGLNLRYTPNLKNKYPCGAEFENSNPEYGSHEHQLAHSHSTGGASSQGGGLEEKGDKRRREPHSHTLRTQYNNQNDAPTIVESPAYIYYIAYMKIV
jgi:hypothetical protein